MIAKSIATLLVAVYCITGVSAYNCVSCNGMSATCADESVTCPTPGKCHTSTTAMTGMTMILKECTADTSMADGCKTTSMAGTTMTDCFCSSDLCNKQAAGGAAVPPTVAAPVGPVMPAMPTMPDLSSLLAGIPGMAGMSIPGMPGSASTTKVQCVECMGSPNCTDETTTCATETACQTVTQTPPFPMPAFVKKSCGGMQSNSCMVMGDTTTCYCNTPMCNAAAATTKAPVATPVPVKPGNPTTVKPGVVAVQATTTPPPIQRHWRSSGSEILHAKLIHIAMILVIGKLFCNTF